MANIMRDIPRADTQPVAHCRLLICMFVPFFGLPDLKHVNETWPAAKDRYDASGAWDERTLPFRLNIDAMLKQHLSADEARRNRSGDPATSISDQNIPDCSGHDDEFMANYGNGEEDDDDDTNAIPSTKHRQLTSIFVNDAKDTFPQRWIWQHNHHDTRVRGSAQR